MKSFNEQMERSQIERDEKWNDYYKAMPFIPILKDWEIKVLPPFGGALMRFQLQKGEKHFSIYFDANDYLGSVGKPYWEAYPIRIEDEDEENGFYGEAKRYYENKFREMIKDIYEQVETVEYMREALPEWYI